MMIPNLASTLIMTFCYLTNAYASNLSKYHSLIESHVTKKGDVVVEIQSVSTFNTLCYKVGIKTLVTGVEHLRIRPPQIAFNFTISI